MSQLNTVLVAIIILVVCTSCGEGRLAILDSDYRPSLEDAFAGLPPLPDADDAVRFVAATDVITFTSADLYDSANAAITDTTLTLEQQPFSWAIFSVDLNGRALSKISCSGTFDNLYLGITDYARERWHWLGGPLNGDSSIVVPTGKWSNSSDHCYIVAACPAGSGAVLSLSAHISDAADWNVLVWMAADSGRAQYAADNINSMESVGSTPQINILVGYDINPSELDSPVAGTDEVWFLKLAQDSDPAIIVTSSDPANLSFPRAGFSSSDPDNLAAFLSWAEQNFPAKQTMLILGPNANGWPSGGDGKAVTKSGRSLLYDPTDGPDDLTSNSLIADGLDARYYDILGFDCDVMGQVEAFYEFANYATMLLVSEDIVPANGWDYRSLLEQWNANLPLTSSEVCQLAVETYVAEHTANDEWTNLAAVDSHQLSYLVRSIGDVAATLLDQAQSGRYSYTRAAQLADKLDYSEGARDLGQFIQAWLDSTADPLLTGKLEAVQSALGLTLVHYGLTDVSETYDLTGLSIWLPEYYQFGAELQADYAQMDFNRVTDWLSVLQAVGLPSNFNDPTLVWSPGYTLVAEWDDPSLQISPQIVIPEVAGAWPEEPAGLAGMIEFSEPSAVSGVASETAMLLEGAQADQYYLARFLVDFPDGVDSYIASAWLEDESGDIVYDFGSRRLTAEEPGLAVFDLAALWYSAYTVSESQWEPGDRLEITWPDSTVDFDVFVSDPVGGFGSCGNTWEINTVDFSSDSSESGQALEWASLEADAVAGHYLMEVRLTGFSNPPVNPQEISIKLYDSTGGLKQDLALIPFVVDLDSVDSSKLVAVLTYSP